MEAKPGRGLRRSSLPFRKPPQPSERGLYGLHGVPSSVLQTQVGGQGLCWDLTVSGGL